MTTWTRRKFIQGSGTVAALSAMGPAHAEPESGADGWRRGDLLHLVPGASHERIVIKVLLPPPVHVAGASRR